MLNSPLSPAQAAQHLLNRRRARVDAVVYAGVVDVPGRPATDDPECELFEPVETHLATHHKLILSAMEETSKTRYGRCLILAPPGSAKSSYATVTHPSHYLGANPGHRLIVTSYGSDLARKMGRRTRSIIRQPRYARIFPGVGLSADSSAADQFSLTNGSEYMASGLLAGITGNRANGAVVDDPLSGREDAQSETIRNKTWDAYQDDLLTRLVPGGWLTMILTRWHEDDPAGRILPSDWNGESGMIECRDGMTWRVLCLQAKCETHSDPLERPLGEYMWPEWFDARHWAQFESNPQTWNSLFQQRPRPPEGAYFLKDSLLVSVIIDGKPVMVPVVTPDVTTCIYAVIDTAIKTGKEHDGTAVMFCGLIPQDVPGHRMVILDWDYVQIEGGTLEKWLPSIFDRLEELARECHALMGSVGAYIEDKGSGMVLLQQAANHGWPAQAIESKLVAMGKSERAYNAAPYVSAGDVKISRHAHDKVVTFKGTTKNHLLSQVLGFAMDSKNDSADDLVDTMTYSVAIGVGGRGGF
jgi:hypothetical protein